MKKIYFFILTLAALLVASGEAFAQSGTESGTITTLNNNVILKYSFSGGKVKSKKVESDGHRVIYECDVEDGKTINVSASIASAPVGIDQVIIYHDFNGNSANNITTQKKGTATVKYTLADDESKHSRGMITSIAAYGAASGTSIVIHWNVVKSNGGSSSSGSGSSSGGGNSPAQQSCGCDKEPDGDRVDTDIRFVDLCGEVSIRPNWEDDDAYEYVEFDTIVYECDRIRTKEDSEAILIKDTWSTYHLKPNSITVVYPEENPKVSVFMLVAGGLWANVKKMAQGKSIELEMSHCVSGIKGTIVAFEEKNGFSNVYLFAGSVEVKSKKGNKKVMLKAGQTSSAGANGALSVKTFDIEKGAKKFGIPMSEIENHYSNSGSSSSTTTTTPERYVKKFGTIKYSVTEGNRTGEMTRWFDDYGRLERRQFKKKPASEPSLYIVQKNITYTLDTKKKTGTKAKDAELNFQNLNSPFMKKLNLKPKRTAKVLGRTCTVYTNSTMEFYVWEGIVLKKVQTVKGVKTIIEATSINLDKAPAASVFKIPSGYSVK